MITVSDKVAMEILGFVGLLVISIFIVLLCWASQTQMFRKEYRIPRNKKELLEAQKEDGDGNQKMASIPRQQFEN